MRPPGAVARAPAPAPVPQRGKAPLDRALRSAPERTRTSTNHRFTRPSTSPGGWQMRSEPGNTGILCSAADGSDASGWAFVLTMFSRRGRQGGRVGEGDGLAATFGLRAASTSLLRRAEAGVVNSLACYSYIGQAGGALGDSSLGHLEAFVASLASGDRPVQDDRMDRATAGQHRQGVENAGDDALIAAAGRVSAVVGASR